MSASTLDPAVAELLADTVPMLDPTAAAAVEELKSLGLQSVGDAGWLADNNEAPKPRVLLTAPDPNKPEGVPFMPAGKVAMLAAPGGTGKSWALVQLAVAVASGKPWLERYSVREPGHVLLMLGEEDSEEMHRRIRTAVRAMGWETAPEVSRRLHALSLCGKNAGMIDKDGNPTEFAATLSRGLETWPDVDGWRLIILDPASRFLGPEAEKDNAQATRFVEVMERLTQTKGRPTVLFAHHTNKEALAGNTDQGSARGSSALTDGVRWQASLDRVLEPVDGPKQKGKLIADQATLKVVKANHCPIAPELKLKRDLDRGGFLRPMDDSEVAELTVAKGETHQERKARENAQRDLKTAENFTKSAEKALHDHAQSKPSDGKELAEWTRKNTELTRELERKRKDEKLAEEKLTKLQNRQAPQLPQRHTMSGRDKAAKSYDND